MQIKKSLLIAGAAATVGVAGLTGFGAAHAAANSGGDSVVTKIAEKFNLQEDEVQAVFEEEAAAHRAEHETKLSSRLQHAVDDGEITAEQKTLIENKLKELHAAHKAERDELEKWAEDQGIDEKYLFMGHRFMAKPGGHGGMGGPRPF